MSLPFRRCTDAIVSPFPIELSFPIMTPQLFAVESPKIFQNYRLMRERSAHKFDDECYSTVLRRRGELVFAVDSN
jgi:hypothetical protein